MKDEYYINEEIKCEYIHINADGSLYLNNCKNSKYHDKEYVYGIRKIFIKEEKLENSQLVYYFNYESIDNLSENFEYKCKNSPCEGLDVYKDYAVIKDGTKAFVYKYKTEETIYKDLDIDEAYRGIYNSKLYGFEIGKKGKYVFIILKKMILLFRLSISIL